VPRLAAVEAIHVRVPFRRPLLDASGEFTHRRSWILRLVDEDGREGLGEATLSPFATETLAGALDRLIREIAPALAAGRSPDASELAAEGEAGRAMMAALDGALESLAAASPARGDPSGGAAGTGAGPKADATTVPVSAAIAFGGPDAGADAAAQAIELGFETLKLRAGFERTTDQLVDRLRAIRAAVGPGPMLRVDAGGAWDLDTAAERIAAIEPFRVEYVEQPLAAWDATGHAALRERIRVPIALDESIDSEGAARAFLAERAADVLIVKPARVGGLAATMRIAALAGAGAASIVLGTYFETGVGIAAALRVAAALRAERPARPGPGRASEWQSTRTAGRALDGTPGLWPAHGLATAGVLVHDLLKVPLPIDHGRMAVPAAISLDESEVERYTLERFEARA
jgi:L-alanine-DL-glutamate epimerase-like enolase superfamily enzyme